MAFALGSHAISAGYKLAAFDQIGSTNVEAMARAPQSAPRGNLASSILEVMDVPPAVAATLGFAAGLAQATALQKVSIEAAMRLGPSAPKYMLKWPNDVLADGKKLVGISLEAEAIGGRLAVVVGIGTNVVGAPEGTPTPAVSLATLGVQISAEELFVAVSDSWVEHFGIWDEGRGFAEIRRLWLERAAGLGGEVAIQTGHATVEGIFDTIDDKGCLIVRTLDGRRLPIAAGDVFFGTAASVRAV